MSKIIKSKKKHKGLPVRSRLFLLLSAFSAIILTVLWLCQVVFLDDIYKTIKTYELKASAQDIVEHIDDSSLEDYARNISMRNELCIVVMEMTDGETGTRVLNIHSQFNCVIHNSLKSSAFYLYETTMENGGDLLQHYQFNAEQRTYTAVEDGEAGRNFPDDFESIVYSTVTTNSSGTEMFVMLNSVITPVTATTRTLFALLTIISVIVILASITMAFIISRMVSKPLEQLNTTAKQLAQRNYNVEFTESGFKEAAELGETLNYASRELSKVDVLCHELIANISHDLRTPLTMISGYGEMLRDFPDEVNADNIQVIIDESHRLTTLVNDVLDISKFQSGTQKFVEAPFCITDCVKKSAERYAKLCERDGYRIYFNYDENVNVKSDETRILQVLYNLINNAITYTGSDKTVTISQRINGDLVRISVTDTGDGIPQEKLSDIWERYYKVDSVHKRAAIGTGLGLSIVKNIMQMANGNCGVISSVGNGSTFFFELKIYDGQ